MTFGRTTWWRVLFILLVLCTTMSVQGASLTAHEHTLASDHCCGVCHVGHLALVYAANLLDCAFSAYVEWFTPSGRLQAFSDPLLSVSHSRAPPA